MPTYNTNPNTDIHNSFYQNQGLINAQGEQINQEALNQLNYYAPLQQQYEGEANQALNQLQQTPGYTPQEASQINVNYGQFAQSPDQLAAQYLTPGEQQGIAGNPNAPVGVMGAGTAAEGAQLNAYGSNLGGELGAYQANLGGQVGNYQNWTGAAAQGLSSGLASAQDKFNSLNTAVNNPGLGFQGQEQPMTAAQAQNIVTAAGTTVGNQYQSAEDQLQRQAAAAGNTSPMAIAAANARLQTQEAGQAGDAMTQARIGAQQAQYGQAQSYEAQRQGETATQAGMQAGAATTEEAAAQNAAALSGTQNIQAAEASGQAGINAANTYGQSALSGINQYGQTAVGEAGNAANQNYSAANTAEQTTANRAATLGTNRQATTSNILGAQYGQAMQTAEATSGGAQNVGQTRIAGQNTYLQGVTGEQQAAQQGGQNAIGQQNQAYGTRTSGLNQSVANRAGYESSGYGNSALNQGLNAFSTIVGGHAKGAIIDKPTTAIIAEKEPEMVIPLPPRYGSRKAA